MPQFKHALLTKGETREILAIWIRALRDEVVSKKRNAALTTKSLCDLLDRYERISNKRTRLIAEEISKEPTPEDLQEMVLKLEEKGKPDG